MTFVADGQRPIQAGASGYLLKDEVKAADVVQAVKSLQNDKPAFSDTVIQTITYMLREASEGAPVVHPLDALTKLQEMVSQRMPPFDRIRDDV